MMTTAKWPQRVAILGGGSFGTAIANIVAHNGHESRLWIRDPDRAQECRQTRVNKAYLPGYPLHDNVSFHSDLASCVAQCEWVVIAIPSKSFREVAKALAACTLAEVKIISTTKGIECDSFTLMSDILRQELPAAAIGVLSGPNFASEIVRHQYTASVIASENDDLLASAPHIFSSPTFRLYTNRDRFGVELAGALKNIYALVTGMAAALGSGHNTQAMLLTRSLAEMSRLGKRLGANTMTFLGLAGMGDLILTCTSDLSRNYRVGFAVGKGASLAEAVAAIGQAVEGVNTLKTVKAKADLLGVYMPLVQGLHAVLFDNEPIATVITRLMTGEAAHDVEYTE